MSDVKCQKCGAQSELFLCQHCIVALDSLLGDLPWFLDRLAETAVGQARLGEPARRQHRAGLERYADPKPVTNNGVTDTLGEMRLEQDLKDEKLRARLLSQGGVNAHASDLFDEVRNMLSGWCRDICERRGLYWIPDPTFIGPLKANEMRFAPRTASAMAQWLRKGVSAIASAESAAETFLDVKKAGEQIERAINRPPLPKTCGPCPTPGEHVERRTAKGLETVFVMGESRSKCGTRLEARATSSEVRCPTCKQSHDVEELTSRLLNDMHYMSFTIRELLDVVLPRGNEHIPRRTLYDWAAKELMKPTGTNPEGKPKYLLADVRRLRATHRKDKAA